MYEYPPTFFTGGPRKGQDPWAHDYLAAVGSTKTPYRTVLTATSLPPGVGPLIGAPGGKWYPGSLGIAYLCQPQPRIIARDCDPAVPPLVRKLFKGRSPQVPSGDLQPGSPFDRALWSAVLEGESALLIVDPFDLQTNSTDAKESRGLIVRVATSSLPIVVVAWYPIHALGTPPQPRTPPEILALWKAAENGAHTARTGKKVFAVEMHWGTTAARQPLRGAGLLVVGASTAQRSDIRRCTKATYGKLTKQFPSLSWWIK